MAFEWDSGMPVLQLFEDDTDEKHEISNYAESVKNNEDEDKSMPKLIQVPQLTNRASVPLKRETASKNTSGEAQRPVTSSSGDGTRLSRDISAELLSSNSVLQQEPSTSEDIPRGDSPSVPCASSSIKTNNLQINLSKLPCFMCNVCCEWFCTKQSLHDHSESSHKCNDAKVNIKVENSSILNNSVDPNVEGGFGSVTGKPSIRRRPRWKCKKCSSHFVNKALLKDHVQTIHEGHSVVVDGILDKNSNIKSPNVSKTKSTTSTISQKHSMIESSSTQKKHVLQHTKLKEKYSRDMQRGMVVNCNPSSSNQRPTHKVEPKMKTKKLYGVKIENRIKFAWKDQRRNQKKRESDQTRKMKKSKNLDGQVQKQPSNKWVMKIKPINVSKDDIVLQSSQSSKGKTPSESPDKIASENGKNKSSRPGINSSNVCQDANNNNDYQSGLLNNTQDETDMQSSSQGVKQPKTSQEGNVSIKMEYVTEEEKPIPSLPQKVESDKYAAQSKLLPTHLLRHDEIKKEYPDFGTVCSSSKQNTTKSHKSSCTTKTCNPPSETIKKVYNCKTCSVQFTRKSALAVHKKQHRIRNFKCEFCRQSFAVAQDLTIHRWKHTRVWPYKCTQCKKCFLQLSKFLPHMRAHNKPTWSCNMCSTKFCSLLSLQKHIGAIHKKGLPYLCQHCPKQFAKLQDLKKHMIGPRHNMERESDWGFCVQVFN